MEEHKVTFKTQWLNSWQILIFAGGSVGILYAFTGFQVVPQLGLVIGISAIIFAVQLIPMIALHLNYLSINKSDELFYDDAYKFFIFFNGIEKIKFSLDDIDQITLYKSFALNRHDLHYFSCDGYNHAVLKLTNSTEIVITSLLLAGEINFPIDHNKVKIKLGLYRWAKGPSLKAKTSH